MNNKCIYCGAEIQVGSTYCSKCGKKQTTMYYKCFDSNTYDHDTLIPVVNNWLSQNPMAANISCKMHIRTGLGLLANKYVLESIELTYELLNAPNIYQYALEEVENFTFFSGFGIDSASELLMEWHNQNPDKIIVDQCGGSHSRGHAGLNMIFDIGNRKKIQVFVFFKEKRKNACKGT